MKKSPLLTAGLSFVFVTLTSQQAFCWADEGHEITAALAQQILTDQSAKDPKSAKALAVVKQILGTTTFEKAAIWPDDIKNTSRACTEPPYVKDPNWGHDPYKGKSSEICDAYSYTSSWHFINSDAATYAVDSTRKDYFKGDMVVMTNGLSHLLKGEPAPILKGVFSFDNWKKACLGKAGHDCKKEALEFLIHLVGDIHQPLHTGATCDLGSNLQEVTFFGQDDDPGAFWCAAKKPKDQTDKKGARDYQTCLHHELHQVWDQNLLVRAPATKYKSAKDYVGLLKKTFASVSQGSDSSKCVQTSPGADVQIDDPNGPLGWANESLCYQPQAYKFPDDSSAVAQRSKGPLAARTVAQADASKVAIPNRCRADRMVKSTDENGQTILVKGAERVDYFTPFAVGPLYYAANIKTIHERLYWGGLRLAALLKDIYGAGDRAPDFDKP